MLQRFRDVKSSLMKIGVPAVVMLVRATVIRALAEGL